eukprot:TRINITY_DN47074_c0_g1_i1.p2 TRINITY_DN47074_c0_g1~~TRINITY_DN47074_c0_g1_i1.p2  ORF type:complete len:111 (+),score=14.24 TRINITY_DN47074_c0_g1_i1:511-843(+)
MKFFDGLCGVHWCTTKKPSVNSQFVEETKQNIILGKYKPNFEGIRFNHYFIKSLEDLRLKWQRKIGKERVSEPKYQEKVERYFDEVNRVTQTDCLEGIELSRQCCQNITD